MPPVLQLVGRVFGRLTVVGRRGSDRKGHSLWLCRCECGNTKLTRADALISGACRSCGCLVVETMTARRTHGHSGRNITATYRAWADMLTRCRCVTNSRYEDYGGRGIRVCERWLTFGSFLTDMGSRPAGLSLDRVDNDGNYELANCRWATRSQQQNNKRRVRRDLNGAAA